MCARVCVHVCVCVCVCDSSEINECVLMDVPAVDEGAGLPLCVVCAHAHGVCMCLPAMGKGVCVCACQQWVKVCVCMCLPAMG